MGLVSTESQLSAAWVIAANNRRAEWLSAPSPRIFKTITKISILKSESLTLYDWNASFARWYFYPSFVWMLLWKFETCSFSSKIKQQLRKVQNKLNATTVRETRNLSFSVLLMIWREVVQIMSKIRNIPLKAPLNVNKENLWKLTDFLKFIAKMGVGEETSISKDAGNYFFSDVALSKICSSPVFNWTHVSLVADPKPSKLKSKL